MYYAASNVHTIFLLLLHIGVWLYITIEQVAMLVILNVFHLFVMFIYLY